MESFLVSIGVQGDVDLISAFLEESGIVSTDDLYEREPTMDDLLEFGIFDEFDRECIFYAVHPELDNPHGKVDFTGEEIETWRQDTENLQKMENDLFAMNAYLNEIEKKILELRICLMKLSILIPHLTRFSLLKLNRNWNLGTPINLLQQ